MKLDPWDEDKKRNNTYCSTHDPFSNILNSTNSISILNIKKIQNRNNRLGIFHENIMSCSNGWRKLKPNEKTGCDIINEHKRIIVEIKNADNTLNTSSSKSVNDKLIKQYNNGYEVILVQVNTVKNNINKHNMDKRIKVMDGKSFYNLLFNNEKFYDNLIETFNYMYTTFTHLQEVKNSLKIA